MSAPLCRTRFSLSSRVQLDLRVRLGFVSLRRCVAKPKKFVRLKEEAG